MQDDLKAAYKSFTLDIVKHNGNNDFELPMPATFVVDQSGKILHAFTPEDYIERLDPEVVLEVLRKHRN